MSQQASLLLRFPLAVVSAAIAVYGQACAAPQIDMPLEADGGLPPSDATIDDPIFEEGDGSEEVGISTSSLAFPRPLVPSVDVTGESGFTVAGRLVGWRTGTTEHLAGATAAGRIIHFHWSPAAGRWRGEDLTTLTGHASGGALTAWVTPDGAYVVDHIGVRTPSSRLVVLYRSSRDGVWRSVDVTARTGRSIAGGLTSWQTPNGPYNVEHLAARDGSGRLLVFWWSPARDWQVVDVTSRTGQLVRSDITSWQVRRGTVLHEYLSAPSASDNALLVFSWTPAEDWRAQRASFVSPTGFTPWMTGSVEHLGGVGPDGTLYVLWRNGTGAWQRVDITAITAEQAVERPAAYQLMDGTERVELLAARSAAGDALVYWWKPSRDWQALDLTEITGRRIAASPEAWVTPSGSGRPSEHLAAVDSTGRVRVFYSYDQPRTLTDRVAEPYASVRRMRNTGRRVLVVLWDPHYPGVARPSNAEVASAMFGRTNSLASWFRENSGGTFSLRSTGVLGWYEAEHPLEWYDDPDNGHDKAAGALRAADPDFNFAAYDSDRDGTLEPHELAIVFAHPGGPGGLVRTAGGDREVRDLDGSPLVLDGVTIRECAEVGIGETVTNWSVVAHELGHLLLALPDMYYSFFTPTAAGQYSIMDSTYDGTHLDAFHKLKLGWAHPRLVFRTGRYTLPDVETRHRVLVLMDPARSATEYFLIENRWPGTSHDASLFDQGLAVWHVMEDHEDYDAALPPPTVDPAQWAELGTGPGAWGRKAIRMIRPVLAPPFDDARALWDAAEGDLVSTEPDPYQPALRWGDGTPSGFSLVDLSAAGPDMQLRIVVP